MSRRRGQRCRHPVHRNHGHGQGHQESRADLWLAGPGLAAATEILIRMEDPPPPEPQMEDSPTVRVSMRLHKRTYELIRELSKLKYGGKPGQVIAACMKVLKMKRIKL